MNRAPLVITLAAAALALAAAACQEGEELAAPQEPGATIPFQTVDMGSHSGIQQEEAQVFKIESQAQWEDFWARHTSPTDPAPPLPSVDFAAEMVIAVVDKNQPSAGYSLEITAIQETEGELQVRVLQRLPGRGCIVAPVITQPFHIVRLARSGLEPSLDIASEPFAC